MSRAALAALLLTACGSSAPPVPPLSPLSATDASCTPPTGGLGVTLDGRCLPVTLATATWGDAEVARTDSNPLGTYDATFVHVRGDGRGPDHLLRVAPDGAVTQIDIPSTGEVRFTARPGGPPIVVAVLDTVGTLVLDARTLERRAGWERMGAWHNATSHGATFSEDGAYFAVPDPYGARVDLVRTADLAVVGALHLPREHGQGPGRVAWIGGGLTITTYPLPYE